MAKPVILATDDDPQVLRAAERDLRRRYVREYCVLRADSGESAPDTLGKLKLRGDPVALFLGKAFGWLHGARRALIQ
jgi:thioredoxin reductase (NADPH)